MNKEAKTIIGNTPEGAPRSGLNQYFQNLHGNDKVRALKIYQDYAAQDITGDYTFQKNIPNGILSLMGHGGGKTENYTLGDAVTAAGEGVPLSRILQEHTGKKPSLLEVLGCNGDGACIDKIIDKSPFKNVPRRTYGTPGHVSTTDTANAARNFAITQKQPWLIPTKEEFVRSSNSTGIASPSHTAEIRPVIPTSVSIPVGIGLAAAGGLAGLYYWNKKRKKELENNINKEAILRGFYKRAQELNKLARGTDEKPGLWANIRAKKQRGESTATPGDKDYPDTKSWNKVTAISEKEASAAWQRSEGKNPTGGLNAKGVASYRAENPGSKLQMAVTTEPSKLDPDSESAKRRKSFCARMSGMPGPMKDDKGRPTRKSLALSKWNC